MRTTLDLEKPILDDLRKRQQQEKGPLGKIASRLLAEALAETKFRNLAKPVFEWTSSPMQAKVDLSDKVALFRELDKP